MTDPCDNCKRPWCYDCPYQENEEARDIADQMFSEEDDRKISASVAYYDICDCWEFNEENC